MCQHLRLIGKNLDRFLKDNFPRKYTKSLSHSLLKQNNKFKRKIYTFWLLYTEHVFHVKENLKTIIKIFEISRGTKKFSLVHKCLFPWRKFEVALGIMERHQLKSRFVLDQKLEFVNDMYISGKPLSWLKLITFTYFFINNTPK